MDNLEPAASIYYVWIGLLLFCLTFWLAAIGLFHGLIRLLFG